MIIRNAAIALALTATVGLGYSEEGKDHAKLTIDQVPAEVKTAINGSLDGGTIKSIEEKKKEGKTLYKVQITTKDGKTVNEWFDDKGTKVEHKGGEKEAGK
jgi:hypothetical protein